MGHASNCLNTPPSWYSHFQLIPGDAIDESKEIACVASVSLRGSSRKLGQEQKRRSYHWNIPGFC